jgi:hypothetical protein
MLPVSEVSPVTAAARRPRLITPHGLAVVAVTVAASLAVLFPGLDFGHPRFLAHPDDISGLKTLLRWVDRAGATALHLALPLTESGAFQEALPKTSPAASG